MEEFIVEICGLQRCKQRMSYGQRTSMISLEKKKKYRQKKRKKTFDDDDGNNHERKRQ